MSGFVEEVPNGADAWQLLLLRRKEASATGLKKAQISKVLAALTAVAASEVKKKGLFQIPGICWVKTRVKPATKSARGGVVARKWQCKPRQRRQLFRPSPWQPERQAFEVHALETD